MPRQFPLTRSFHNLVWNIKHYQPYTQRPPFRATRHPFCTNIQLREASCAFWLKETSKELGQKLVDSSKGVKINSSPSKPAQMRLLNLHPSALHTSTSTASLDREESKDISPQEVEIVKLYQNFDFAAIYEKLKAFKAEGVAVSTDIINEMTASLYNNVPQNSTEEYAHQSVVEAPMFHCENDLRLSNVYSSIFPHLPHLHKIFALYEPTGTSNEKFLQHYIWLSYHMEDLATLQKLSYLYLKSDSYDTRTLGYIINAFVYSYDVEFSKSLLQSIIGMNKHLDESLLSSTMIAYVKVGAIYGNIYEVFRQWFFAENCESPFPKTMALVLDQTLKYGTADEIEFVNDVIERLGYNNNFLIGMVRTQTQILLRDHHIKKSLTEEDVASILELRNTLARSKYALKVYYESYLKFFAKNCNMTMISFILKEMKKDGIPVSKFAYDTIVSHYVSQSKFVQLYSFMNKFVSRYNKFELFYAKQIFDAFLRTYPYHGGEFAEAFGAWVQGTQLLTDHKKDLLKKACLVNKVNSNVTPYAIATRTLDHRKYSSSDWSSIDYNPQKSVAKAQQKHQIHFRIQKGINDLMRKGIKPDYSIMENTLRHSNAAMRVEILKTNEQLRMTRKSTRLQIYHFLMTNPTKEQFAPFIEKWGSKFNTSDKLLLARRTMNKYDFQTSSDLLKSINAQDMTDSRKMILLNLSLRNNIYLNDFEACVRDIEGFPINEVTLSPYIRSQCLHIEKNLRKKINSLANEESQNPWMEEALSKLHGLIGDIDMRIKKDNADIRTMIQDALSLLSSWAASKRVDERKV